VANLDRGSVSIRDDGVGISASIDRDRVEPFQTGDTVTQGAGLGLSIVQEIMAAHGGTLTIASPPRRGTTACLRFAEAF
jgi:signal transduction histidine kinase